VEKVDKMATPLDLGILQHFEMLWPFLFVTTVMFGVLSYGKLFGDNKAVHALLSVLLGIMVLFSPVAVETINRAAPWFIVLFVFFMFAIVSFKIFGVTDENILWVFKSKDYGYVNLWIIALILIITLGSLSSVLSERGGIGKPISTSQATEGGEFSEQEADFWATLFHPKVLGMALILLIATFTVQRLSASSN